MTPTERLLIDDQARQQRANFATQQFEEETFTTDTDLLAQWVAEVELAMDPDVQGDYISEGLDNFFATPGRSISEESAGDPLTYLTGLQAQLIRNGVKLRDSGFRRRVDDLKERILREESARAASLGRGAL